MNTSAKNYDPADMMGHVLSWPRLLEQGFSHEVELPDSLRGKSQIVCCGMGGSAIGAGLVADYLEPELSVPMTVIRDYDLPAYIDAQTLVLCLSYSGGTEETLAAYAEAKKRGSAILTISTGGVLAEFAAADGIPSLTYAGGLQPRAALPLSLGLLLNVISHLGYVSRPNEAVAGAIDVLATLVADDQVKQQAQQTAHALHGRVPIVYGAGLLGEAARRLKGQISENANQTAAWEVLPEQNHNALVGYEKPDALADQVIFVFLRHSLENARHTLRFIITEELLDAQKLPRLEIQSVGETRLDHLVSSLFLGDLISVYLAYANGVDPTPVDVIMTLKARLAEVPL